MTERSHAGTYAHDHSTQDGEPVQRSADLLARRVAPAGTSPSETGDAAPVASGAAIQMFADAVGAGMDGASAPAIHAAAAHGMSGAGGALPHLDAIQRSFGRHDVRAVQAHVGGAAAEGAAAMGARAYASGGRVAFAAAPDLHLAAHEAAHVVQQRGGVQLSGGVGAVGDVYERHADAVADTVVRGDSAEALLDEHAPSAGAGGGGVQRAVQMDVPAGVVHGPRGAHSRRAPTVAGAVGTTIHLREHTFFDGRVAVGPYVYFTGAKIRGSISYDASREAGGEGGEHAEEPATTVHGAVGGAPAHGSHHGHVGIEGEVEHRFCELWGGAEIAGSAGGEVSTNGEANVSVGLALGHLNLGNGFQVPLPHASLHLADLSREHGVRFLVGEVVVPFGVGVPLDVAGVHVMVTPAIEIVLEFAPNWLNIAPHLTGEAAELAAEGAEAVEAAEVAGAGAETVGAVSAEAEAALVAEIGLAELAVPGAVIIAGAAVGVLAYEWIQDFAHHEHVWAASRANARTLFMYCMGYTSAWCGTGDMGGLGASQGSAAARRDIAAVRARYPGIELAALVRQWGGPQRMYDAIYEVASPVARDWAIEHLHAEGLDVDVIRANIRQTRWGGQLWGQFVGEAGAPTRR